MTKAINETSVKQVCRLVDKGVRGGGIGIAEPGEMCIEAVISFVFDHDSGVGLEDDQLAEIDDHPSCVDDRLCDMKIGHNDGADWESDLDRGKGLKRIAIAQLGSVDKFDSDEFASHLEQAMLDFLVERAPKNAVTVGEIQEYWEARSRETFYDIDDVYSELVTRQNQNDRFDYTMSEASWIAAEMAVIALKKMKIKGTKFLYLAPRNKFLTKIFGKEE
jgi:hypothetical protein